MKRKNAILANKNDALMFSRFSDRKNHTGIVPSSSYLISFYKSYHYSVKNHMAKEVKKRSANALHFYFSNKEAKPLHQHKGASF